MKLFLDDERYPPYGQTDWRIARDMSMAQFICMKEMNKVQFISFDHDLGQSKEGIVNPTGYDFAKWLVNVNLEGKYGYLPKNFQFTVHSQNPVGKENIEKLMNNFLSRR